MDKPKSTSAKRQYFRFSHKKYASLRRLQPEIQRKHTSSNVIRHAFLYLQWLKVSVAILGSEVCPGWERCLLVMIRTRLARNEDAKHYNELKQMFKTRCFSRGSCSQQQQQQGCRPKQQHNTKVDSKDGTGSASSTSDSAAAAGTSQQNGVQLTLNSEKKKACGNDVDKIKRKYNQRKCLKKFCGGGVKGPDDVKDTKKEHNYCSNVAASADKGRSRKSRTMGHNLQNVDGFTPDEAVGSPDESNRKEKAMETQHIYSFRLECISSSSPGFKKLHDLYLENRNCHQDLSLLPYRTEASGSKRRYRSSPRHRYGGVDPMWAQYIPSLSCSSPQNGALTVRDLDTSSSCSPSLSSQLRDCNPVTPPLHTRELLFDQENSPLQAVLDMNLFGSPTSKNSSSSSPRTPSKTVCNVGREESCNIGYPPVAPLSPWNTRNFVPYSPSLFSVRAALLSGRTSSDEASDSTFLSPQGIEFVSRCTPNKNCRIRPVMKTPTKPDRAGEFRHNLRF